MSIANTAWQTIAQPHACACSIDFGLRASGTSQTADIGCDSARPMINDHSHMNPPGGGIAKARKNWPHNGSSTTGTTQVHAGSTRHGLNDSVAEQEPLLIPKIGL
eukprot:TRINITY_DN7595_c0_g1_i2.p1 TRINITY_DN7595_c0_g1~~TRINITY_DN7595_c0_g1_i2.p1  ORF type:complete len:105 (-),score=0.85 TRINITY_DN7595_c0_g1_i2:209-523(-)